MQYIDEFDFTTITFPVNSIEIQKFEKANPTISIFAHYFVKNVPMCAYRSSIPGREKCVHLLHHDDHWIPITNLQAFYRENAKAHFLNAKNV